MRLADRTNTRAVVAGEAGERQDTTRFGQSIRDVDIRLEATENPIQEVRRERIGRAETPADAANVVGATPQLAEHAPPHGRHAEQAGRPPPRGGVQHLLGIGAIEQEHRRPHEEMWQEYAIGAAGVEERIDQLADVLLDGAGADHPRHGMQIVGTVREECPLGEAGRAAGVEDDVRIVGSEVHARLGVRRPGEQIAIADLPRLGRPDPSVR